MTTISNKMRKASLLFAGAMLALHLSAQEQRALTGTIYEPDGKTPLIGAMIKVKGTSQGTVSDIDGNDLDKYSFSEGIKSGLIEGLSLDLSMFAD